MTDVQVSNARRIGFTALALVIFWVVAWKAYSIACDDVFATLRFSGSSGELHVGHAKLLAHSVYQSAAMALIPMLFLAMSVSSRPRELRSNWLLLCVAPIVTTVLVARYLGLDMTRIDANIRDALSFAHLHREDAHAELFAATEPPVNDVYDLLMFLFEREFVELHETPSPWLLLPIILTTAFVIFGAWQRAVRDSADLSANHENGLRVQ